MIYHVNHRLAIFVASVLALLISGCSKAKEGAAAMIEGEVATDAELKPLTNDGILAQTDALKFTPKTRAVAATKIVKQSPPETAARLIERVLLQLIK